MSTVFTLFLYALLGTLMNQEVRAECCGSDDPDVKSKFCDLYKNKLSAIERADLHLLIGPNCRGAVEGQEPGDEDHAHARLARSADEDGPNFLRFGRKPNFLRFGKRNPSEDDGPNFLRFGRKPNFLRFGRSADEDGPNFLRFGRKPNFLRLGKREDDEGPNFLRFGRDPSEGDGPNFLRFGRAGPKEEDFEREMRKPNFLRFG